MINTIVQTIRIFRIESSRKLYDFMFHLSLITGNVKPYEQSLIERLRSIYHGGIPASVILLIQPLCNGWCYDRATLLSAGMDKFDLVYGSVRAIRLNPNTTTHDRASIIDASDHCWVESNGWVYDTSLCLKMKKWFYYLIEGPIIRHRHNQDWCLQQELYQEMMKNNIEQDKWSAPLIIPLIEPHISNSVYDKQVTIELELFKEIINYDQIRAEMEADMIEKGII